MRMKMCIFLMLFSIYAGAYAIDCRDYIPVIGNDGKTYQNLCTIRQTGAQPASFIKSGGGDISVKLKDQISLAISDFSGKRDIRSIFGTYIRLYRNVERYRHNADVSTKKEIALMYLAEELALKIDSHIKSDIMKRLSLDISKILKDKFPAGEIKVTDAEILSRETHTSINRMLYRFRVRYTVSGKAEEDILNAYFNGDTGIYHRPQEGGYPYEHMEKDVLFASSGAKLSGTLSYPKGDGTYPAVLLIAGSGPNNRDAYGSRHRMFQVLADNLVRQGYAVLRYDKRGVEGSTGKAYPESTTSDYLKDAESGINFLKTQNIIRLSKIGILGHSEGGMIASMIASRRTDISFLILLATPARPMKEIIYDQRLTDDDDPKKDLLIKNYRSLLDKLFPIMTSTLKREEVLKEMAEMENSMTIQERIFLSAIKERLPFGDYEDMASPWFKEFLKIDIKAYLSEVRCPILVLVGDKDSNVNAERNIKDMSDALGISGNKSFSSYVLSDTGHMFQKTSTFSNKEYHDSSLTFSPEGLLIIDDWLKKMR